MLWHESITHFDGRGPGVRGADPALYSKPMQDSSKDSLRTAVLTAVAMLAFAGNSVLCRMALGQELIDAASFTTIRILAGAITLALILLARRRPAVTAPNWPGVLALFGYMVFFSFAYRSLTAATGALLLFGTVQMTMLATALRNGERFSLLAWAGLFAAFSGLVYLLAPGVAAPDPLGAALMALAGVAWGVYSLIGQRSDSALLATSTNFVYCVPIALGLSIAFASSMDVSAQGAILAVASGALASGVGYAIWYAALSGLTAGSAATVQLSVPVIAAIAGVVLLSEPLSLRLVVASALTIGGIWLALATRLRDVSANRR